jgi:hypothetical protein
MKSVPMYAVAVVLWLFGHLTMVPVRAQINECSWPNSDCNEPWVAASNDVWVELSDNPPCSVMVRIHWRYRCNEYELMDVNQPVIFTSPTGCATQQQVHAAWFDGRIVESVKQQLDDLALGRWLYFNASCCPCPQQYSVMVGKVMSCQKLLLRYTLPSGSVVSIEYDMSTPWTTYEAQISMVGGTNPVIVMIPCLSSACCYRSRTFCMEEGVVTNVQYGPWFVHGTCQPSENETCQLRVCE